MIISHVIIINTIYFIICVGFSLLAGPEKEGIYKNRKRERDKKQRAEYYVRLEQ